MAKPLLARLLRASLAAAALLGFVGYGLSLVLFVLALREIGTARTGAYYSTAPFIRAVIAFIAVREPVTLALVISGLLMAVGVWLHLTERHEHEHKHEPLTHTHSHVHDEHHQHEHDPLDPPGNRTLTATFMSDCGISIPTFRTSTTNICTERLADRPPR
jgi:hypothetical protein